MRSIENIRSPASCGAEAIYAVTWKEQLLTTAPPRGPPQEAIIAAGLTGAEGGNRTYTSP